MRFFQQLEWVLLLNLLPACGSCSPNWAALSGLRRLLLLRGEEMMMGGWNE
ncbi:hypothetical protein T4A_442 [Trichinella pseudospiralis]|uniref:Uncharacterized protein n=1 Tax=Trichinella pseudospiralis TaxID=6337 RepID=A0A0V1CCV4_TRIPS|nr:hypothetical protein T4A_442 [Trichinella pseudospiralis]